MNTAITLSKADAGKLQDAWHYAQMLLNREMSTFNGDREYPEGLLGQVKAYENLLDRVDEMTADNETWELVGANWYEWCRPATFRDMVDAAQIMMAAIESAASRLGIEARTGEREREHCSRCGSVMHTNEVCGVKL